MVTQSASLNTNGISTLIETSIISTVVMSITSSTLTKLETMLCPTCDNSHVSMTPLCKAGHGVVLAELIVLTALGFKRFL